MSKLEVYFKKPFIKKHIDEGMGVLDNIVQPPPPPIIEADVAPTPLSSIASDIQTSAGQLITNAKATIEAIVQANKQYPEVLAYAAEASKLSWDSTSLVTDPAAAPIPVDLGNLLTLEKDVHLNNYDPRIPFLSDLNLAVFHGSTALLMLQQVLGPAILPNNLFSINQENSLMRFFMFKENQELNRLNQMVATVDGMNRTNPSTCIASILDVAAETLSIADVGVSKGNQHGSQIDGLKRASSDIRRISYMTDRLRYGYSNDWLSMTQLMLSIYGDLKAFANDRIYKSSSVVSASALNKDIATQIDKLSKRAQTEALVAILGEYAIEGMAEVEDELLMAEKRQIEIAEAHLARVNAAKKADLARQVSSLLPAAGQLIQAAATLETDIHAFLNSGLDKMMTSHSQKGSKRD